MSTATIATALTHPLAAEELASVIAQNAEEIEAWFAHEYQAVDKPFYASVDIRHSGNKLVPVDTNIFPAGFNNLSEAAKEKAAAEFRTYFTSHYPQARKVMLVPESHTRNLLYLDNVVTLRRLFEKAGMEVVIGRLAEEEQVDLVSASGEAFTGWRVEREGDSVQTNNGFIPDIVVVNNDFTSGPPHLLCGIRQPVIPSPKLGWYQRRKSVHFTAYSRVVRRFCQKFKLDSAHFEAVFERCGNIDFGERKGLECVAIAVDKIIHQLKGKYAELGIESEPYVFIKADSGTYGMGIMTAHSGEDVLQMNKKVRNKMDVIKEGTANSEVIIQEGVPTIESVDGYAAELLFYTANAQTVGGMYRFNAERDAFISLNTPGMGLKPITPDAQGKPLYQAASLIARLAVLAAAYEHYTDCDHAA